MKVLGYIIGFIGTIVYYAFAWGLTFDYYWDWFIIPVFNVQPITLLQGIGLWLFVGLIKPIYSLKTYELIDPKYLIENYKNKQTEAIIIAIFIPWITLYMGWIFNSWFIN